MIHGLRTKDGRYNKVRTKRHLIFEIETAKFDNTALVTSYAERWLRHGFVHESMEDAAEQCSMDLKDPSARMRFKSEIKRLKKYFHTDE